MLSVMFALSRQTAYKKTKLYFLREIEAVLVNQTNRASKNRENYFVQIRFIGNF